MIASDLEAGRLHMVKDAPSIDRIAYAVCATKSGRMDLILKATKLLKKVSKMQLR
jgi:hypothetical protein